MYSAKICLLLLLAAILVGCAHRPPALYQWGSYEDQIYAMYTDPGKVPLEDQLHALESDYQSMRDSSESAPPGFHAHLGYLYFQTGNIDQALQSFATEKSLFPESTVFMDRLIARIKK